MFLQQRCTISFAIFLLLSSVGIVPAIAGYNDSLTCNDTAAANVTEYELRRYGQCLTYRRESGDRPTPCDMFFKANVDRVFLPYNRALNNLDLLFSWAADINIVTDLLQQPCRDVGIRGLCYYYFPPCGNVTHFEPPSSLCESSCRYLVDDVCQQEWIEALEHFDNLQEFLTRIQIDILNCSQTDLPFQQLPHCCSDAGIEEIVDPTTTDIDANTTSKTPSLGDTAAVITATSVTVAVVTIFVISAVVVVLVLAKRFSHSKVVLQVTGNSLDIAGLEPIPPIILHKDSTGDMFTGGSLHRYIAAQSNDHSSLLTPPRPGTIGSGGVQRPRVASCYIRQMAEANLLIPAEQIQLLDRVGQGEFGVVYRGHLVDWKGTKPTELVAVKTLREEAFSAKDISDLVEESLKMKAFQHKNVLSLIGVCIDAGAAPYLVMPYMLNGSLLAYLRKERPKLTIVEGAVDELITEAKKKLLSMCLQIAKGMEYLATRKFVHRDLAARNCMIDANFTIKVADFGLSEDVYCKDYFRQALKKNTDEEGTVKLPIKWMALESLEDGIFTEKTDVWSFGITCWEVFSLGRSPYPGVDPFTLIKYLREGKRLDKPANAACTGNVHNMMLSCWSQEAGKRPPFADLVLTLTSLLEEVAEYMDFATVVEEDKGYDHLDKTEGYDHLEETRDEPLTKGYDHLEDT